MKGLVLKVDFKVFTNIISDSIDSLIIDKELLVFSKDHILIRECNTQYKLTGRACIIDVIEIEDKGECVDINQQLIKFKRNPLYHLGY